ncbi:hypothetical protein HK104_001797 [Borealophlyctis nickersoniae]|nr:hypothetical protein HK104_001797 [Borealophlyctis nickersoniae]
MPGSEPYFSQHHRALKGPRVSVTFGSQKIECTLDVSLSVASIVKNLGLHQFALPLQPTNYCLRVVETEELVTDEKLRRKIRDGDNLKLVSSPAIMAAEMVRDLSSENDGTLKRTLFLLQKYLKEEEFADEFLAKKGLEKLEEVIIGGTGNTLAYALTSLQTLMEHDHGWDNFPAPFISTLVSVIVKQNLVNICRPATAIIIKLVLADKSSASAIQCYGFDTVNHAISAQSSFLPTLVHRLSATDYLLQLNSMHLINVLFRHATERARTDFVYMLDALNTRKTVMRLMQASPAEELANQLVEFQRLLIQEGHRRKRIAVDTKNPTHEALLKDIWEAALIEAEPGLKWRKIGFDSESPKRDLARVGVLGLETLHGVIKNHPEFCEQTISEQLSKPAERRCPFVRAGVEVCELLADHWEVSTGYSTSTTYHPLLLVFEDVFYITLATFFRLWEEMQAIATGDDINRVANVLRSQFKHAANGVVATDPNALYTFEREMMESTYGVMRERQMKDLEVEDDLLTKLPVRNLRERLNKDSYDFVKQQRIKCLTAGAWFPVFKDKGRVKGVVRFYRLGPNYKSLHYGDFSEVVNRKPGLEELSERIDMSLASDLLTGTSSPIFRSKKNSGENPSLVFSLVSASSSDTSSPSLADFACASAVQYSEWLDGFNMLLDKNIANKDTAEYIQALTDVGVKLALLDLTGEGIDVVSAGMIGAGDVPELPKISFWYDDGVGGIGGAPEGSGGMIGHGAVVAASSLERGREVADDADDAESTYFEAEQEAIDTGVAGYEYT